MKKHTDYINSTPPYNHNDFPYLVLNVKNDISYPMTPGFRVYHWHEDLQFIYVTDGSVSINVFEKQLIICKGEGAFINKNVIHLIDKINSCQYKSFLFSETMVSFFSSHSAETLTKEITENKDISVVVLQPETAWCNVALHHLDDLSSLESETKDNIYRYAVLSKLSQLWLVMLKSIKAPQNHTRNSSHIRMKEMLCYIETHFSEDISLDCLSSSAGISKSECLRCFKSALNTTPYKYIMEYRLKIADDLLLKTAIPVSEIALRCGFNSQSYFGKCFKEKTGLSPRQYRSIKSSLY